MQLIKLAFTVAFIISAIHSATSKVYKRCELAKELRDIYGIPENQLATWICIIGHESSYNTSAISDGAENYGLFQINREYWCSKNGRGCGIPCSALRDDDIRDDVNCAKHIFKQQGFKAWSLYSRCKTNVEKYIRDCYEGYPGVPSSYSGYKTQQTVYSTVAPYGSYHKPTYYKPKFSSYIPVAPVQSYEKQYYKTDNDYEYQTAKDYKYSYNWSWNSKDGYRFNESGQRPKNFPLPYFLKDVVS